MSLALNNMNSSYKLHCRKSRNKVQFFQISTLWLSIIASDITESCALNSTDNSTKMMSIWMLENGIRDYLFHHVSDSVSEFNSHPMKQPSWEVLQGCGKSQFLKFGHRSF